MQTLSFDQLPAYVADLGRKLDDLFVLLQVKNQPEPDEWFDVAQLRQYLPDKPSQATVYGWVQARAIPHGRNGKKLIFLKSDIDQWLRNKAHKDQDQINVEAEKHLSPQSSISRRQRQIRGAK